METTKVLLEYKAQIRYLTEQLKVYKSEISLLEEELNEIESKYTKKQTALEDRIKELEAELKTKEQQLVVNKFPGLIPIIASEEIDVNQGYIKKAKFRINKSFEGYFIGAEYEVYSEFVPIKPKFTVFFFNADGLNIGTDTVDWEFTHVLRGQTEVIVKGIPMAIPNSEPKYFLLRSSRITN
ncbi:MAG: hypothetical protein H7A34_07495 [bacterium]|nr:hypothetical protein [bacterium]